MKRILLTRDQFSLVDGEDFEWLSQWKWHYSQCGYAVRSVYKGNPATIPMHRMILQTPRGHDTDHVNGNKLDNQRRNLRVATRSQNMMNAKKRADNTSGYKGVSWFRETRKWCAKIQIDGRSYNLGYADTREEAFLIYSRRAKELFGEFSRLN
ncbi:MAG: HNH endonuclease [Candidatus Eisenbacteria bacterium]|nr:HNH endonuclease [Candidatus Eisenbacteria bacterium]